MMPSLRWHSPQRQAPGHAICCTPWPALSPRDSSILKRRWTLLPELTRRPSPAPYTARPTLEVAVGDHTELVQMPVAADPNLRSHVTMLNVVLMDAGRVGSLDLKRIGGKVHERPSQTWGC